MSVKPPKNIAVLLGAWCVLAIPYFMGKDDALAAKPSICPFMRFLGIPCPGCGLTKSIAALYRGGIVESLKYNPLGIVIAVCCCIVTISVVYDAISGKRTLDGFLDRPRLWQGITIVYTIYYLVGLAFSGIAAT